MMVLRFFRTTTTNATLVQRYFHRRLVSCRHSGIGDVGYGSGSSTTTTKKKIYITTASSSCGCCCCNIRPRRFSSSSQVLSTSDKSKGGEGGGPSFKEDPVRWIKNLPSLVRGALVHTWIGFKLLGLNIRTACGLIFRLAKGYKLTRREYHLLVTTAADIFRMVPFSFFIIVPMAEFLLPAFIMLFPGMLPSTFITPAQSEAILERNLILKLKIAKFMIKIVESVTETELHSFYFVKLLQKIKGGEEVSHDEIYRFVRYFNDDIMLENLKRSQLQQMCRFLDIVPYGPTQLLRFQLSHTIKKLKFDDEMIRDEHLQSLTLIELKQACAARGMSSLGSRAHLEDLMNEWLDLSLNLKVPTVMLILSHAFRLSTGPRQTSPELLLRSIFHLPEKIIKELELEFSITTTPREKYEVLVEQREKVKEEQKSEVTKQEKDTIAICKVEDIRETDKKVAEVGEFIVKRVDRWEHEKREIHHIEKEIDEIMKQPAKSEVQSKILIKKLNEMLQRLNEDLLKAEQASSNIFNIIDHEGKRLTCDELLSIFVKAGIEEKEAKELVEKLDRDKDGFVELEHVKKLQSLDINIDSLKAARTVEDENAKKRAELYFKKKHQ